MMTPVGQAMLRAPFGRPGLASLDALRMAAHCLCVLLAKLDACSDLFMLTRQATLQEYVNTKRKEHAALDKDYKAYEDARKALEAAKAKASEAKDAVKAARAAVLEALKTVSDPPATVRFLKRARALIYHFCAAWRIRAWLGLQWHAFLLARARPEIVTLHGNRIEAMRSAGMIECLALRGSAAAMMADTSHAHWEASCPSLAASADIAYSCKTASCSAEAKSGSECSLTMCAHVPFCSAGDGADPGKQGLPGEQGVLPR